MTNEYSNRLRTKLSLQQPTGVWTNGFAYDTAKRLTNVSFHGGNIGYTFLNSASHLTKRLALPNTAYITNTYDLMARLTGTYLKSNNGVTLNAAEYGYNLGHQRTTSTNAAGAHVAYTYDAIGQLKWANSVTNSEDRGYAYDAAWNLTRRTNQYATDTFTMDGKNQVTNASFFNSQAYDANGNRTNTDGGAVIYEYDDENQLTFWEGAQELRAYFTYDGQGRLRLKQEYTWDYEVEGWINNGETRYVYDGKRVIQERSSANSPLTSYTRGNDLSGSLEGAGGIGGMLARSHGNSSSHTNHHYYHADGNGNITLLVNTSQHITARYRYDAFGNTLGYSGSMATANTYQFSSKEYHANSGLYYYGFRWYEPLFQRWVNHDPVGEPGFEVLRHEHAFVLGDGPNRYLFVGNNPMNSFDAYGLTEDCGAAASQALSSCMGCVPAWALDQANDALRDFKRCLRGAKGGGKWGIIQKGLKWAGCVGSLAAKEAFFAALGGGAAAGCFAEAASAFASCEQRNWDGLDSGAPPPFPPWAQ